MLSSSMDMSVLVRLWVTWLPKLGLRELYSSRSSDVEIVVVVENDTCAVDALQVVTGCTMGKGNLIFHDYGKQAYIFIERKVEMVCEFL